MFIEDKLFDKKKANFAKLVEYFQVCREISKRESAIIYYGRQHTPNLYLLTRSGPTSARKPSGKPWKSTPRGTGVSEKSNNWVYLYIY